MDLDALKYAEARFLAAYPGGFEHEEMKKIGKKHNVTRLAEFCHGAFAEQEFAKPETLLQNWVKVVSRSSMVSMFEKPKFKSFIAMRTDGEKSLLVDSLYALLHGDMQSGFELQLDLLKSDKLAKWSLITVLPAYYQLNKEVFIKPTTAKGVIKHFELQGLEYKPTPSWAFYRGYRKAIMQMKKNVDKSLRPNNPAFCGFLMMSFPDKLL